MKDGNQNRGQNNKQNKKGYNKNNQNVKIINNNEQSHYYRNNRKYRNYPNTNPNFRKNKKRKDYQYMDDDYYLHFPHLLYYSYY